MNLVKQGPLARLGRARVFRAHLDGLPGRLRPPVSNVQPGSILRPMPRTAVSARKGRLQSPAVARAHHAAQGHTRIQVLPTAWNAMRGRTRLPLANGTAASVNLVRLHSQKHLHARTALRGHLRWTGSRSVRNAQRANSHMPGHRCVESALPGAWHLQGHKTVPYVLQAHLRATMVRQSARTAR